VKKFSRNNYFTLDEVFGSNDEFAYVRCTTKRLKEKQFRLKRNIKFMTNINSYLSLTVLYG